VTAPKGPPRVADHFVLLLALLSLDLIVSAFADSGLGRIISAVVYLATAIVAFRAPGLRSFRNASVLVAIGVLGIAMVVLAPFDDQQTRGVSSACAAVIVAGVFISVMGRVLQHERVTVQTIAGAVCAYLLIGYFFSLVYCALDLLGSSYVFGHAVAADEYTYFSFVTLTTLGYGDLAPATDVAQRLAATEAMSGQILLVTMVARLVSAFQPRERT
jgi:hypothetical protein